MSLAGAALAQSCAGRGAPRCGVCSNLFAALTADERAELDRSRRRMSFAAKDIVFAQGDAAGRVFNLSEGVVRIYRLLPDGRRQVVGFALPGDFLGLTLQDHHALTAEAIESAAACSFSRVAFRRLVDGNLAALRRMNQLVSQELTAAHDRMMMLGRYTAEEKMAAFLLSWRERQRERGRGATSVKLPMSRRDIADYLGLTIETVSRTFTKLERAGVIAIMPGGVRIADEARAAKLAAALPGA
ncbi:MAG TPA: helix-turn-helix domain-containing protein [Rhodoblastus sp.]|nr:helix-turn-helix domain-containing protein [Rhodoblastus sp.]